MIQKPHETTEQKKHIVIIAGIPGIGKTTLALSAPAPLLINTDDNYQKVKPVHRVAPHITPKTYGEIKADLSKEDLSDYKTLIFDTGGTLVNFMKVWATTESPGKNANTQRDGITLSMKGYGAIKAEFENLMNFCRYTLRKHIILIFHATEKNENDRLIYRLDIAGSSGDFAWKISDLGAFMSMSGNRRQLQFSPTEYHHAKSAYGISGPREIPETHSASDNDFMTNLFQEAADYQAKEGELLQKYNTLMEQVRALVEEVQDPAGANDLYAKFKGFQWVFASKREAWKLLKDHCCSLGLEWSREFGKFIQGESCT